MSFTQFFILLLFNNKQQLDKQTKVPTFKIVSVEQVHKTSNSINWWNSAYVWPILINWKAFDSFNTTGLILYLQTGHFYIS